MSAGRREVIEHTMLDPPRTTRLRWRFGTHRADVGAKKRKNPRPQISVTEGLCSHDRPKAPRSVLDANIGAY